MKLWVAMNLSLMLKCAAVVQLVIALLNLNLVRILGWRDELAKVPPLLRQVFCVHSWFISITLAIFAAMTWRFAPAMATGEIEMARWLAGAIGAFWLIRTILQVAYYSPAHWRGKARPTVVHVVLLLLYGGMSVIYGITSIGAAR